MRKLYVFDLDNTLYDALSRLQDLIEGYDPFEQEGYGLTPEQLACFSNPDFYVSEGYWNTDVVRFMREKAKTCDVMVVSASPNAEVAHAKSKIVESLGVSGLKFYDLGKPKSDLDSSFFKDMAIIHGQWGIVPVDDAPYRLELFRSLGLQYKTVRHLYNEGYETYESDPLYPEYVIKSSEAYRDGKRG